MVTRPIEDKEGGGAFQVYRQPLPAAQLYVEDLPDSEGGGGGAFRGAFSSGNDKGILALFICVWVRERHGKVVRPLQKKGE